MFNVLVATSFLCRSDIPARHTGRVLPLSSRSITLRLLTFIQHALPRSRIMQFPHTNMRASSGLVVKPHNSRGHISRSHSQLGTSTVEHLVQTSYGIPIANGANAETLGCQDGQQLGVVRFVRKINP